MFKLFRISRPARLALRISMGVVGVLAAMWFTDLVPHVLKEDVAMYRAPRLCLNAVQAEASKLAVDKKIQWAVDQQVTLERYNKPDGSTDVLSCTARLRFLIGGVIDNETWRLSAPLGSPFELVSGHFIGMDQVHH